MGSGKGCRMVLPTSGSPFLLLPAFAAKRPLLPPSFDHSAGGSKRPSFPTAGPVPWEKDDRKTQTHVHQYSRGARSVRCPSARFSSQNRRTHPPSHRWHQCIHGFQTQRPGQNRWGYKSSVSHHTLYQQMQAPFFRYSYRFICGSCPWLCSKRSARSGTVYSIFVLEVCRALSWPSSGSGPSSSR